MSDSLPDILVSGLNVVFCGINPAQTAAAAGHHFSSPTNRFWRVLHDAGFTPIRIDPENDRTILRYGYGLTAAVARPTRQAADVSRSELAHAAAALEAKIRRFAPRVIAFLGKPAYSAISQSRIVAWGAQPVPFAGAAVWVLPNPSGRNRQFTMAQLVAAYAELRKVTS